MVGAAALLPLDAGLVLGSARRLGPVDALILILGLLLARLQDLGEGGGTMFSSSLYRLKHL